MDKEYRQSRALRQQQTEAKEGLVTKVLLIAALVAGVLLLVLWASWPSVASWTRDRVLDANKPAASRTTTEASVDTHAISKQASVAISSSSATFVPGATAASGAKQSPSPTIISLNVTLPNPPEKQGGIDEVGQAGDSFGSLNALLSAIAGIFLMIAAAFQFLQLRGARAEHKFESKARERQQFEATFFQLLDYTRKIEERFILGSPQTNFSRALKRQVFVDRFSRRPNAYSADNIRRVKQEKVEKRGADALGAYAFKLDGRFGRRSDVDPKVEMARLVHTFHTVIYSKHPSWFGPYFRVLYQTFKHIHNSPLDPEEKIEFANIARGQISEAAVFLLAVNAWGPWGYKFVELIEEYGLLEHLHRRYRRDYFDILKTAYSDGAFLGSVERKTWNEGMGKAWTIPAEGTFFPNSDNDLGEGADGDDEE